MQLRLKKLIKIKICLKIILLLTKFKQIFKKINENYHIL